MIIQSLSGTYCPSDSLIVTCEQLTATKNAIMQSMCCAVKVAEGGNWMRWLWRKQALLQEKKLMNGAEFKAMHHAVVLMSSKPL